MSSAIRSGAAEEPARRAPGRPRRVSDEEIYVATLTAMADFGAAGLTLARVAERVGVTAAAVRQRYGSKHALLVAMARMRQVQTQSRFDAARAAHPSPLAALEAAFVAELWMVERPEQVGHIFSAYTELASDPEIGRLFGEEIRGMARETERFLRDAFAAGEIDADVTPGLAQAVVAVAEGTMLLWSLAPDGDLSERVVAAIGAVLRPGSADAGSPGQAQAARHRAIRNPTR